jgi:hypothetical protein
MTTMTTTHPFTIHKNVNSSAVEEISLQPASDGTLSYDATIIFRGGREYVYNVEDDATAEKWYSLLSNDEDRASISWGAEVNRAIRHGDIELAS